jgi:hypothetical protein
MSLRGDVSDMAQSAAQAGHGNKARLLRGALRQLDQSLENASEGFVQASRNFAQASRYIEAVQAGREAATHGRSEDVISAYQALRPLGQVAFRSGYVDASCLTSSGCASGGNQACSKNGPRVHRWGEDKVDYERELVAHEGSTCQSLCGSGRVPPDEEHWICVAVGGLDGLSFRASRHGE